MNHKCAYLDEECRKIWDLIGVLDGVLDRIKVLQVFGEKGNKSPV